MTEIRNLGVEITTPDNTDLIPIQKATGLTGRITRGNLLAGLNSSGGGLETISLVTTNFTASAGDRLLVDNSVQDIIITLPPTPYFGDEITLITTDAIPTHSVKLDIGNQSFQRVLGETIVYLQVIKPYEKISLVYCGESYGWMATPQGMLRIFRSGLLTLGDCVCLFEPSVGITHTANKISSWANQATNQDAIQATASLQPEYVASAYNNHPAVRFNATELSINALAGMTRDFTIFLSRTQRIISSGGGIPWSVVSGGNEDYLYVHAPYATTGSFYNARNAVRTDPQTLNTAIPYTLCWVENGIDCKLYNNKTLMATYTGGTAANWSTSEIGFKLHRSGFNCDMDVYSFAIYSKVLSESERNEAFDMISLGLGA